MKPALRTTPEVEGFRGCFYRASGGQRAVIVLLGDEGDDFMSMACARWLTRVQGVHALCIAVRQEKGADTGVRSWPLELVQRGADWLKGQGMNKIGIFGMSMQAAMALSAAARVEDISLTLALSPCDFVPWGYFHGKLGKERDAEWPSGGAAFSWGGQELPFQPAGLEAETYWQRFRQDSRRCHEMRSRGVFDQSEEQHPIETAALIPIEQIRGTVVLAGTEDDSMWDACRYIRRMKKRMGDRPAEVLCYSYGTHLMVPQRMLAGALPLVGGLVSRMFASGRKHPRECRKAREDLEEKLTDILNRW